MLNDTKATFKETNMSVLLRSTSSVIALAAGLLAAVGYYTEAHRAPDQS